VRHGLACTRLLGWLLATLWLANLGDLLLTLHALAVVLLWLLRRRSVVLPATAVLTLTFVALVVYEAFWLASR
jgi:hypothetical protein